MDLQRRVLSPLASDRHGRSDLASLRLKGSEPKRGLNGHLDLEITGEGEYQKSRGVVYAGSGAGAYDALGNYVGTGDYNLVLTVSTTLAQVARAATSGEAEWRAAQGRWRGTRATFDFESETHRRGELKTLDVFVPPEVALSDPELSRATVLQRLEGELLPESRVAALKLRAERRVSGDRTYENFSQTLDDRSLTGRWRARPGRQVSSEVELALRRRVAGQVVVGGSTYARTLIEQSGTGQLIYTPDARLRAVAVLEFSRSRPEDRNAFTRTIRLGPDLSYGLGKKGRAELKLRRAFVSGPEAVSLLPSADDVSVPRWEASTRVDYRVRESTTAGLTLAARERAGRSALVTGRAEVRAFF